MQRRQILDIVVSIVKMIGKRGTSYREIGSSEEVHTLINEKIDHATSLETCSESNQHQSLYYLK